MKDWDKLNSYCNEGQCIWKNSESGDLVRVVHRDGLYFYDVRNKDRYIMFEKGFKNKSQTLKFAKSYMRSH